MDCEGEDKIERRRRGPSTFALSVSGLLGILGLAGSGVATYNSLQNDIASLKRGELYQERTNERLSEELKSVRVEQRETMREFNDKLDRVIDHWSRRK